MRIGIFGGTFDPPHVGHLLAASDALEALALDRVIFVPAAEQPLKAGLVVASTHDRLVMLGLMVGNDPRFVVDAVEVERGGISFTVDTLRALRERWCEDRDLVLFLLLGEDVFETLPKWREPTEVASLAKVAVLTRAGRSALGSDAAAGLLPASPEFVLSRRIDISSTEIRDRLATGRSVHGFVSDAVLEFVVRRGLYL